ncbi:hypothetical protein JQK87_37330 [Streptomyces sp. G44]|uniref:hypothetical protein n=1 Tax=Streptomyces sp. G44 TaxID=2807632 RepID=UPI00195F4B1C|nr:hypothetical protein [Streptomyces sp. G44]MBM7173926.1 hypothetical protein [Streptomyces sp. G44]
MLPGEFRCLTGGNGPGKTNLLRAFPVSRRLTGGAAAVARWPQRAGGPGDALLLAAGPVALVPGARFPREMKTALPIALLLPVVTSWATSPGSASSPGGSTGSSSC